MESLLNTAARALAEGQPLFALKLVALRDDARALALRGVALAQLGDYGAARKLLRRAARAFGPHEALSRARCAAAEAEVALATRDLRGSEAELIRAEKQLEVAGDLENALFAQLIRVKRWILLGQLERAKGVLEEIDEEGGRDVPRKVPARLVAARELARADIQRRGLRARAAEQTLELASRAARAARIPALLEEVTAAQRELSASAARLVNAEGERALRLSEVEELLQSDALLVDACRREVRVGERAVSLVRRPVLMALSVTLAEYAPRAAPRTVLIERAFASVRQNESHRARLRVEIGRLRKALAPLGRVQAEADGFTLSPITPRRVLLLVPPAPGEASALIALLAGGAAWSTSALTLALGQSQRSLQRALASLEEAGKVRRTGSGRSQRWVAPPGNAFATTLLLTSHAAKPSM